MKVVLVRKDYKVGEVTTFNVSHVCEPKHSPGQCPEHNIYVEMDVDPMSPDKAMIKGVCKYEVDVMVNDVNDLHIFRAVSMLKEKGNSILVNEVNKALNEKTKCARVDAYRDEIDPLFFKIIEADWSGDRAKAEVLRSEYLTKKNEVRAKLAYK
jgi:hypothetical protein